MPSYLRRRAAIFTWLAWHVLVGFLALLAPERASAQVPAVSVGTAEAPPPAAPPGDGQARKHFERALELYRAGQYAPALDELQAAAVLDPNGKDLFFNLALVHEKLGQLEQAIAALERFRELETDATERDRAQVTIERLRGAERAGSTPRPAPAPAPCPRSTLPAAENRGPSPLLIGAASLAVVSLVVGVVFGAKAMADDPEDERTSASVSVEALRARGERAEREALVADVAFALAAASTGTVIALWALQPSRPQVRSAGVTVRGYF